MKIYSSLFLLGAAGVLTAMGAAAATADTSAWACKTCPYPKGTTATLDVGLGSVSESSAKFGDFTGLQRKGAHLVLGGSVQYRGDEGYHADAAASDLGLDVRSWSARVGREGRYALDLSYDQFPRHLADGALTPFIGAGGSVLSLPAGFPAPTTAAMPLATTLGDAGLGGTYRRFDLGSRWMGEDRLVFKLSLRVDERSGTKPVGASFFSTTALLAAPVDQQTQQFEAAVSYVDPRWQGTLAFQLSRFQNREGSLTWSNPFTPVSAGATRGQLALAPDNQFAQVTGSLAYQLTPDIRASADVALGQMTQDALFLASTLNTTLAASVPALPAPSLDARVDTFNAGLRVTAQVLPAVRVNASLHRDVRENVTPRRSYPSVATDLFLNPVRSTNTPFSQWQDRGKLSVDVRGPGSLRLSLGADQDNRERNYSEAVLTRETTLWGRVRGQPTEWLGLSLKMSSAERSNTGYGIATWFGAPENPLLRKYNMADRRREAGALRADVTLSDTLGFGLFADASRDDYSQSLVGLREARNAGLGADIAWTVAEGTRLNAFAQSERVRSAQAGSQIFLASAPDWEARTRDRFDVMGVGLQHAAIPDKLDLGADLSYSRSRSDLAVQTGVNEPDFPRASTTLKRVKLFASYKLKDSMTLHASIWHEDYASVDWRLDGLLPATVSNLLSLGQISPRYRVLVVSAAIRHRF